MQRVRFTVGALGALVTAEYLRRRSGALVTAEYLRRRSGALVTAEYLRRRTGSALENPGQYDQLGRSGPPAGRMA